MAGHLDADALERLTEAVVQLNEGKHPDMFVRSVFFDLYEGDGGPEDVIEVTYNNELSEFVVPLVDG